MTPTSTETVSGLLGQARGGDRRALERLFALGRSYLAVLARAQIGGRLRAKFDPSDLVQQTLLEAYRGFDGFQGGSEAAWLAWLRRILARNAIDQARRFDGTDKRRVRGELSLDRPAGGSDTGPFPEPADGKPSPSSQLVLYERDLRVAHALAMLSPDHREVVVLRNLQGLPFDEVARHLGRSRPATQMLWMRAIQKLQALLTEGPPETVL